MGYIIQDKEAGNPISEFAVLEDAEKELARYEEDDRRSGEYTENFYEIIEKY